MHVHPGKIAVFTLVTLEIEFVWVVETLLVSPINSWPIVRKINQTSMYLVLLEISLKVFRNLTEIG